ncbi:lectin C-type domain protein [Ancylostoma ceylanicum]|uniref:Lectin C-type domain protein n=1 Tax=Ancylostoma ceylanicum TaxID=53326 RepID=A0A0D6MAV6_9BILA|nr:lectin C-type domain protein [Ancylostoma ceylanicum]
MTEDMENASFSRKLMRIGEHPVRQTSIPNCTLETGKKCLKIGNVKMKHACRRLRGTNAHLVYVNNEDKQQIIEEYGKGKYASFQWLPPVTYHIGLSYNQSLKTYLWEGGAINAFYSNWDDSYPDLSKGECVRSEAGKDGTLRWRNEECASVKASTKSKQIIHSLNMKGHWSNVFLWLTGLVQNFFSEVIGTMTPNHA